MKCRICSLTHNLAPHHACNRGLQALRTGSRHLLKICAGLAGAWDKMLGPNQSGHPWPPDPVNRRTVVEDGNAKRPFLFRNPSWWSGSSTSKSLSSQPTVRCRTSTMKVEQIFLGLSNGFPGELSRPSSGPAKRHLPGRNGCRNASLRNQCE